MVVHMYEEEFRVCPSQGDRLCIYMDDSNRSFTSLATLS